MSLDQLTSQIAKFRAQAAGIQEQWTRTTREVGGDRNLTDHGKRTELDRHFADMKAELAQLRDKEKQAVQTKRESLERALFGLSGADPNKIIAYRDAQDRAARVTDEAGARALYDSAMISNDDSLAKAILAKAVKFGYRDILDDWSQRNPVWREELNDLKGIQYYDNGDGNVGMQRTMAYAIFRGLPGGDPNGGAEQRLGDWLSGNR